MTISTSLSMFTENFIDSSRKVKGKTKVILFICLKKKKKANMVE